MRGSRGCSEDTTSLRPQDMDLFEDHPGKKVDVVPSKLGKGKMGVKGEIKRAALD